VVVTSLQTSKSIIFANIMIANDPDAHCHKDNHCCAPEENHVR